MIVRDKITDGPNERSVNETISGTDAGIPNEALPPGQDLPVAPSDAEVGRIARLLDAPLPEAKDNR